MKECPKCFSTEIDHKRNFRFFEEFVCESCGYWTYGMLKECCIEPYRSIKLKQLENGQRFIYYQCENCGGKIIHPPLSFKKFEHRVSGLWDSVAEQNRYENFKKENIFLKIEKLFYNTYFSRGAKYREYLKSDKWQEIRKLVLERDDYKCRKCNIKPATAVHHLTYNNVGNEKLSELISICDECHEEIHRYD
ncbi:HNH endonuclease [Salegentibacter sp. F14]